MYTIVLLAVAISVLGLYLWAIIMAKKPEPPKTPQFKTFDDVINALMGNCEHGSDRWLLLKLVQLQQELNTLVLESLDEIRHVKRDVHEVDRDVDEILELLKPVPQQIVDFTLDQIK